MNHAITHLQPFVRGYLPREVFNFNTHMRAGLSKSEAKRMAAKFQNEVVWMNDLYQVNVAQEKAFIHLSIKRRDRQPIHDWRDLQAIKDMLVGPDHEGLELYPRASRVVDTANQYHLWVLKDPKVIIPVGFPEGLRMSQDETRESGVAPDAVQREFAPEAQTLEERARQALQAITDLIRTNPDGDNEAAIAEIAARALGTSTELTPDPEETTTTENTNAA